MANAVIEVAELGKVVPSGEGRLTILHEISFSVIAGEAVAIVGASGSGKSTLLGLMAGLDLATSGKVVLGGQDLAALDEDGRAELRGRILGFVFQSFQLLPALTALENTMLPLELAGRSDARATAEAMLQRVGLGERLGHYPTHLSGGEQQRVALARAFAMRPQLLLADEPTGNLDPQLAIDILGLFEEINEAGATVLFATHDRSLLDQRARRVIVLDEGKAVDVRGGVATPEEDLYDNELPL